MNFIYKRCLNFNLYQDENDNEEAEDGNSTASTVMETDSVDYPDLLQVPMCVTSNSGSSTAKGRKHPFLQRSDSTLCLGCPPLDPFDTIMSEALPLADQPHLLQPHSRREDLFGVPRQPTNVNSNVTNQNPLEGLPTRLGLSARLTDNSLSVTPSFSQVIQGPGPSSSENRRSLNCANEPGPSKSGVRRFTNFQFNANGVVRCILTNNFHSLLPNPG